jgi:uncharacterized protein with von Willebrand factor type A (vWA) domain
MTKPQINNSSSTQLFKEFLKKGLVAASQTGHQKTRASEASSKSRSPSRYQSMEHYAAAMNNMHKRSQSYSNNNNLPQQHFLKSQMDNNGRSHMLSLTTSVNAALGLIDETKSSSESARVGAMG